MDLELCVIVVAFTAINAFMLGCRLGTTRERDWWHSQITKVINKYDRNMDSSRNNKREEREAS